MQYGSVLSLSFFCNDYFFMGSDYIFWVRLHRSCIGQAFLCLCLFSLPIVATDRGHSWAIRILMQVDPLERGGLFDHGRGTTVGACSETRPEVLVAASFFSLRRQSSHCVTVLILSNIVHSSVFLHPFEWKMKIPRSWLARLPSESHRPLAGYLQRALSLPLEQVKQVKQAQAHTPRVPGEKRREGGVGAEVEAVMLNLQLEKQKGSLCRLENLPARRKRVRRKRTREKGRRWERARRRRMTIFR